MHCCCGLGQGLERSVANKQIWKGWKDSMKCSSEKNVHFACVRTTVKIALYVSQQLCLIWPSCCLLLRRERLSLQSHPVEERGQKTFVGQSMIHVLRGGRAFFDRWTAPKTPRSSSSGARPGDRKYRNYCLCSLLLSKGGTAHRTCQLSRGLSVCLIMVVGKAGKHKKWRWSLETPPVNESTLILTVLLGYFKLPQYCSFSYTNSPLRRPDRLVCKEAGR